MVDSKITVLVGDNGHVDFSSPIEVSEDSEQRVVDLLKNIFDPRVVLVEELSDGECFRDSRLGQQKQFNATWSNEEYQVLLQNKSMSDASRALGRSPMAVQLKDGDWRFEYYNFWSKKGADLSKISSIELIKEFMDTKEKFKSRKRDRRKEKKQLLDELADLESPSTKRRLKHAVLFENMKSKGDEPQKDVEELISEKKRKLKAKIKEIDEELKADFLQWAKS